MPREQNVNPVEDVVVAVKSIKEERRIEKRVKIKEAINAAVFSKEKEKKESEKKEMIREARTEQPVTEVQLESTLKKEEKTEKKEEKNLTNIVEKTTEELGVKPEIKKKDESLYSTKKDLYGRDDAGQYARNDLYQTHGAAAKVNVHEQHTQQELYRRSEAEDLRKKDAEHPKKMKTLFEQGKGEYIHG